MLGIRTLARAALALTVLACAPARGAWAHSYPDPGGHQWQLTREEKVRYFIPADQTSGPTTRQRIKSKAVSTSTETQGEKQGEEPDEAKIDRKREKRDGPTWTENQSEGRLVTSFEKHQVDTWLITKTPILDVRRWEERVRTLLENTYKVTRRLTWIDPLNGSEKDASVTTTEGPLAEPEYGPWEARIKARHLRTDTKEEIVDTQIKTRRLGSVLSAARNLEQGATANSGAFSGDKGKGADSARTASVGAGLQIAGAGKVRASGNTIKLSGSALGALLEAARRGAKAHDATGAAWYLQAAGTGLLFYPYNSAGQVVNDALNVPIDNLKAAGRAGQVFIDRIDASGGLTLVGTFKNRYQGGRSAEKLTVK
jgi:hypothetical protein